MMRTTGWSLLRQATRGFERPQAPLDGGQIGSLRPRLTERIHPLLQLGDARIVLSRRLLRELQGIDETSAHQTAEKARASKSVQVEVEAVATALLGAAEALGRWWLASGAISASEAADLLISTVEPGLLARTAPNPDPQQGETPA